MHQDSGGSISWPWQPTTSFSPIPFPLLLAFLTVTSSIARSTAAAEWREAMIGALTFSLLWVAAKLLFVTYSDLCDRLRSDSTDPFWK